MIQSLYFVCFFFCWVFTVSYNFWAWFDKWTYKGLESSLILIPLILIMDFFYRYGLQVQIPHPPNFNSFNFDLNFSITISKIG